MMHDFANCTVVYHDYNPEYNSSCSGWVTFTLGAAVGGEKPGFGNVLQDKKLVCNHFFFEFFKVQRHFRESFCKTITVFCVCPCATNGDIQ